MRWSGIFGIFTLPGIALRWRPERKHVLRAEGMHGLWRTLIESGIASFAGGWPLMYVCILCLLGVSIVEQLRSPRRVEARRTHVFLHEGIHYGAFFLRRLCNCTSMRWACSLNVSHCALLELCPCF